MKNAASVPNLHSTMYLLKPHYLLSLQSHFRNLHSTMYLLKQVHELKLAAMYFNLHSTMYLLKQAEYKQRRHST